MALAVVYARVLGATSFTVIVRVLIVVPPLFVAVTIYDLGYATDVGVPEITPVDSFKWRPDGRAEPTE